jgi:hypothetical protein
VAFTVPPPKGYVLTRLDTNVQKRDNFSCGKPELDTFLRTQAAQAQDKSLSVTHVLIEVGDPPDNGLHPIVGYVTLVSSDLPLVECPKWVMKKITNKPTLPALLIAKMGVDTAHKGKRLGEYLLTYSLGMAFELHQTVGLFAVFVDAKDNESRDFYLKYNFVQLPEKSLRLFLPMSQVEKLFSN